MEIIINGQQLDFSLENEKTVGDILSAIETDCTQSNATITRICIDGHLVNEGDFEKTLSSSLDTVQKIQLETMNEDDALVFLQNISSTLESTIEQLVTIPVLLQSNKDSEVSSIVMDFVDRFHDIQQFAYFCSLFPKQFSDFTIENQNITTFLKDFTSILQEFETSLSSKDTVLTGDLAEYEIVPRLQAFVAATSSLREALC